MNNVRAFTRSRDNTARCILPHVGVCAGNSYYPSRHVSSCIIYLSHEAQAVSDTRGRWPGVWALLACVCPEWGGLVGVVRCALQDKALVTSSMCAHLLTQGIPLHQTEQNGVVANCDDWVLKLYQWRTDYVDKLRRDLVRIGAWDLSSM